MFFYDGGVNSVNPFSKNNIKNECEVYSVLVEDHFKNSNGFLIYEGNFKECATGTRIIDWNDKFIKGFWN